MALHHSFETEIETLSVTYKLDYALKLTCLSYKNVDRRYRLFIAF